ncbi:hypothetical protein N3K66_003546 [Trichothecium roseum]|uniref:Uncharacterized protein n=1 Tax=Trichothecium roseum TaxID=47278 RepID=A0ACC0V7N9_9HYPO|nr:hypothetical protein N3K66_003546 [Trichothecium roseum]
MPLLQLPPEILTHVMDHVGSSYFQQDPGRLTISKRWFIFARAACFDDLRLTRGSLRRLLSSRYVGESLPLISMNLESLDLDLEVVLSETETTTPPTGEPLTPLPDAGAADASDEDEHLAQAQLAAREAFNDDLARLAPVANKSQKLRTVRIQGVGRYSEVLHRCAFVPPATIGALLSAENLTVLELDLFGVFLTGRQFDRRHDYHVCTTIGALLTQLTRLRLRMYSICTEALRPQTPDDGLRLSEVVVNLGMYNDSPAKTSVSHATSCAGGGVLKLAADMQAQAAALAARMASPKTVRVLTYGLPHLKVQATDVLTGKKMILEDGMGWEDDGEPEVEDVGPDSEPESEVTSLEWSEPSNE